MEWKIKHIFNYTEEKQWGHGHCAFGFHGKTGTQYVLQYNEHWVGCLNADDTLLWTAGAVDKGLSPNHIPFGLEHPHYVSELPDGSLLVSGSGTGELFKVWPERRFAELLVNTRAIGLRDLGNCIFDEREGIWVHEIEGCRVWRLDLDGRPLLTLGNGQPGFQGGTVPYESVQFSWIYDLRLGPDGNVYVLDSKNFSVRRINVREKTVSLIAGTGKPGYSGDGGPATEATLGGDSSECFDGPYSLSLDEEGNIFVGDTCNHVVRMVDHATDLITTIAGTQRAESGRRNDPSETDPLRLNLPKICSMDYYGGQLFVPDWSDDLIVLERM